VKVRLGISSPFSIEEICFLSFRVKKSLIFYSWNEQLEIMKKEESEINAKFSQDSGKEKMKGTM